MKRLILGLVVLSILWCWFNKPIPPFPQFTDSQLEQICIEEGIY